MKTLMCAGRRLPEAVQRAVVVPGILFLTLIVALGCAGTSSVQAQQAAGEADPLPAGQSDRTGATITSVEVASATPELEAYTDTIPGTLVAFDMVPVPAGTVTLETPEGPKEVEVGPFWMRKTEVTWDEFDVYAFLEDVEEINGELIIRPSKPYGAPDRGFGHKGYAALSMSYGVAATYAQWLSLKTGDTYRLPTEAEWEYACRAGLLEDPGADKEKLEEVAWYWDNAFDKTHPVASLQPNPWGLYDMLGNALEWCTGLDGEPLGCGGHYNSKADQVSCSARLEETPAWQETDPQIPKSIFWLTDATFIGFRIIRVPE